VAHGNEASGHEMFVIQVGVLDDMAPLEATPVRELNVKHRLSWVGKVPRANQRQAYTE
jgi:hypothetical protein